MTKPDYYSLFLYGVPARYVVDRLAKAGGHELTTGKLASPESSAALAVNTFAWFHDRPECLPRLPMLTEIVWIPTLVEVEYCARLPWSGGTHPWLDAWVETSEAIIGVESKRFEPYRAPKKPSLSKAYDRSVWGDRMAPYEVLRDKLRSGAEDFEFLDAVQLVKHAFGLVTEGRRKKKRPYLVYLFAEPKECGGRPIAESDRRMHREEIARFAAAVSGAEVGFGAISYREWLESWSDLDLELVSHREAIIERFQA